MIISQMGDWGTQGGGILPRVPATHGYRPGLDGVTVQSYFLPPAPTPSSLLLLLPESLWGERGSEVSV